MKLYLVLLITIFLIMQYMYWFGESGFFATRLLVVDVKTQADFNERLVTRNNQLRVEIDNLKSNDSVIEAIAREELGMIKPNEKFYLYVDQK